MAEAIPFGVSNNNPLNIRPGDPWEGVTGTYHSPRSGDFLIFKSVQFGFRSGAVILQTYYDKYKLDTLRKIISRWAPSAENDTAAYIAAVAKNTGFDPDEAINPKSYSDAWKLLRAMTMVEVGSFDKYFKKWQLDEGLKRAGIADVPPTPLASNVTAIGGAATAVAGAASGLQPAIDAINENKSILLVLGTFFHAHPFTGLAIAFGILCVVAEVVRARRAS